MVPRSRSQQKIRSFADVLALWTPRQLSRLLGIKKTTVAGMYQRQSIAPPYWQRIIEIAAARGEIITADMLVSFASKRKQERSGIHEVTRRPARQSSLQSVTMESAIGGRYVR